MATDHPSPASDPLALLGEILAAGIERAKLDERRFPTVAPFLENGVDSPDRFAPPRAAPSCAKEDR